MKSDMKFLLACVVLLGIFVVVAVLSIEKETDDCQKKGGVRIAAKNGHFCVSPEVLK
jgi:hypothetical protein